MPYKDDQATKYDQLAKMMYFFMLPSSFHLKLSNAQKMLFKEFLNPSTENFLKNVIVVVTQPY